MEDNDPIEKENVEEAILKALDQYHKTHKMFDLLFWRHVIWLLADKYGFEKQLEKKFNEIKILEKL